ncbi:MAG: hypothetical protein GXO79_14945 [Chlorobi bacterium]|nr:hypothetical protein [Chlorobiota bacterium]
MNNKQKIFLAIDNEKLINELIALIDKNKYSLASYNSEIECIENLHKNPDILLIDYHLNNNTDVKEKKSVSVIEKIKENKLSTKVFMFSEKGSAKTYINIISKIFYSFAYRL